MEDEPDYDQIPLPPDDPKDAASSKTLPWLSIPEISLAEHYRLCFNKYDKKFMRPIPHSSCPIGKRCMFHHTMRGLKAPAGYVKNPPLPPGQPGNFQFVCSDWGSGHELQPRLTFQQEETFPTRITQMVQKIVAGESKWLQHKPLGSHEGWWGKLCYNFTFFGKCIHWNNCLFLHVTEAALRREFKMWPCMCSKGPRGAEPCPFKLCPYPHRPAEMTVPDAFRMPAYEAAARSVTRELVYNTFDASGGEVVERAIVLQKHIANTPRHGGVALCQYTWCNDADCRRGVHLLPSAWTDRKSTLPKSILPDYFVKEARLVAPPATPAPWAKSAAPSNALSKPPPAPPKAPPKAQPSSSKLTSPHSAVGESRFEETSCVGGLSQAPASPPQPAEPAGSGYPSPRKVVSQADEGRPDALEHAQLVAVGVDVPRFSSSLFALSAREAVVDGFEIPEPEDVSWPDAIALRRLGSQPKYSLNDGFLNLLEMGPPSYLTMNGLKLVQFVEAKIPAAPQDDLNHLRDAFDSGLSKRYNKFFERWLASGQLQRTFLSTVGVYTHPNLMIGKGAFAEIRLGLMKADGREVALKIFHDERDADSQFKEEVRALKRYSRSSGTVQYFNSYEESYDTEEGITKFRKVIVLELMEGSLADVLDFQKEAVDSVQHMQLVRYVTGSLLVTLAQLNYGPTENLVHRDVKPDNIMVDRDRYIRLIDFGTSRVIAKHQDLMSLSVGLPMVHLYASPEATRHNPKAHRTSDLYSLGMVIRAMLRSECHRAFKPWDHSSAQREIPSSWPAHQRFACEDLLNELMKPEPHKRAYFDLLKTSPFMNPHQLVMSHPFFWTARTCVKFLVALGNFESAPFPDLNHAIQRSYDGEWFPHLETMEQEGDFATTPMAKSDPFKLLKFIRNKYVHKNDRTTGPELRRLLHERPVFLETFPRLVINCWTSLLPFLDDIFAGVMPLQDFYGRSFDVDKERRLVDTKEWL